MLFEYIINNFGEDHVYLTFYVLNLIFAAIAYKLGFAKKLSTLKSIIVYFMLAIGMYVLTIFSILPTATTNQPLPITESLIIVCAILGIYRFRLHQQRKTQKSN